MVDDRGAEGDVDPVGGVGEQIGAQGAQHRLGDRHAHQQGAEHIEAAEVALADHRIDDLLDKQRIEQPKQLHKEAGDQHLDQNLAVLLERRQKPAQAKTGRGRAGTALHRQHRHRSIPVGTGERLQAAPLLLATGIAHQGIAGADLPEQLGVALLHHQHR